MSFVHGLALDGSSVECQTFLLKWVAHHVLLFALHARGSARLQHLDVHDVQCQMHSWVACCISSSVMEGAQSVHPPADDASFSCAATLVCCSLPMT
eukprot:6874571-Alexandrium_andersonii.AAC.1